MMKGEPRSKNPSGGREEEHEGESEGITGKKEAVPSSPRNRAVGAPPCRRVVSSPRRAVASHTASRAVASLACGARLEPESRGPGCYPGRGKEGGAKPGRLLPEPGRNEHLFRAISFQVERAGSGPFQTKTNEPSVSKN